MALFSHPTIWTHYTDNIPTTPAVANIGTAVTAGANNADGTAVTGLSALTHDVEWLEIGVGGFNVAAGNGSTLLDVMTDPAGGTSWASLIDDLLVGHTPTINIGASSITSPAVWYSFPIFIKAGSTVGLVARTAHSATLAGRVILRARGGHKYPSAWACGQKVTSIGIDAANSKGTDHTPGNSGTPSAWASLGSATTVHAIAAQVASQGDDSGTNANLAYRLELGVGSNMVGEAYHFGTGSNETLGALPRSVSFCDIPSGSQLQVRAVCSGTAAVVDTAAYITH